jgi:hypothetical protein
MTVPFVPDTHDYYLPVYSAKSRRRLHREYQKNLKKALLGLFSGHLSVEPSPGQGPKTVGFTPPHPHGMGGFLVLKSSKETEFNQFSGLWIMAAKFLHGLINCHDLVGS